MENVLFPLNSFKALVAHHIALIERFSEPELAEFSLLFLKLDDYENIEIKKSIQIVFRDSDIIFEYDENYIILLPKTDWNGAIELLNGLQEFLGQAFQDSIVTYPDDGENAEALLESFKNVVKKYYNISLEI
ncbi:MAG: hypothetical protein DSZ05_07425 [Sulfurospirillum sp.]|nr:MAG: hypothetical protein DSZ05_07425 [Sulfurospirillum sp.]